MSENRVLIRAAEIDRLPAVTFRHPLNPASEIHPHALSALAGLERVGLYLGRVPPGRESFCYHSHQYEEEFVYILSGRGIAEIGNEEHEVGPGDAMLFTAPSVAHHLRNPFVEDLVYLMGGERRGFDIGEFPRLGKRVIFDRRGAWIVTDGALEPFTGR